MLQVDKPEAVTISPAVDPGEVLIEEVRRETRRRRLRIGIALLLVVLAGGIIAGVVSASGNSAPPPRATSAANVPPASFPEVSAALAHVPAPLREALLNTMAPKGFIMNGIAYQAPGRYGPPPGHNYKVACQGSGYEALRPSTIVGSYEYNVYETCPGAKLSVSRSPVPKSSLGLTYAQSQIFSYWITELQGSLQFHQSANGYAWVVGSKAFPGETRVQVSGYLNVPGDAVIQNSRVTALILYMRFPSGKVAPARFTFSQFNDAPSVAVPKVSLIGR